MQETQVQTRQPKAPMAVARMPAALELLNDLISGWRSLPLGTAPTLSTSLTEGQQQLSTLRQLMVLGEPRQVLEIIQRLLAMYPRYREAPDSVAEDWIRHLVAQPLASIWACYDRRISSPGRNAPTLGDFLVEVKNHARLVESTGHRLAAAVRSAGHPNQPNPSSLQSQEGKHD